MEDERKFELVRHDFTDTELSEKKDLLVSMLGEVESLKAEKASMVASVSLRLKTKEKETFMLRQQISQGFVEESVEIFEFPDDPVSGQKRIVRVGSGEERIVDMSMAERQRSFKFEQSESKK